MAVSLRAVVLSSSTTAPLRGIAAYGMSVGKIGLKSTHFSFPFNAVLLFFHISLAGANAQCYNSKERNGRRVEGVKSIFYLK
jgi:hypothetical protein